MYKNHERYSLELHSELHWSSRVTDDFESCDNEMVIWNTVGALGGFIG